MIPHSMAIQKQPAMDIPSNTEHKPIRVKLISPLPERFFKRMLPQANPTWGHCMFSFDPSDRDYDWLVVYEDLPGLPETPRNQRCEQLACPAENTLLVTSEPPSIKYYGREFTHQFGYVLTSQSDFALPHPRRIYQQSGLAWIYGLAVSGGERDFEWMRDRPPSEKSHDLSLVFSGKRMRMTLHNKRFQFMQKLVERIPEMHVFGRMPGHRPLDNKADAFDAYRYSIILENHIEKHHWTEKLADAFLGLTLPFYVGCPNVTDYFPEESVIPIDIYAPVDEAVQIIRQAVADKQYEKRVPAIQEARRRVLFEHNLFSILSREIEKRHDPSRTVSEGAKICSRHALRRGNPEVWAENMIGKLRTRLHYSELF